jgi:hypothetical protein
VAASTPPRSTAATTTGTTERLDENDRESVMSYVDIIQNES